jgi:hypothetical protein
MQQDPLMEQLDWFFTTTNWNIDFPNTMVLPLAKPASDHIPCVVDIDTVIPRAKIFRFENFWVQLPGFLDCVHKSWNKVSRKNTSASILVDKLKTLRYDLKHWKTSMSKLKQLIENAIK